ncbi:hypothetical protein Mapa_009588 [Marchantia paleacea]|nr:hypothetical protein Mapa_009588 [Marchantia paleacea]
MHRFQEDRTRSSTCYVMACWFVLYVILSSISMVTAEHSVCLALQPSPALTPFVDELPIPPVINVSNGTRLVLGAYKISQKLHRDLPPTTLYAYGTSQASATFPGPTLVARKYKTTSVRWENHINDTEHMFTVDRTIHWADPPNGGVPMVVHLHGSETRSDSDGHPDAWFTAAGDVGPTFTSQNYVYPNDQEEALLWYHDHTVGMTRMNSAAGMVGLYFIKSKVEELLPLPSGAFEIPLVILDRTFWANGSINFPDIGANPADHPNWCPDYYGDTILVNGKVWPFLEVYRTKYRFRMLTAGNARFFNFSLSEPSLSFVQIGTDGGFLHKPLTMKTMLMAPAYRNDVIIDFSSLPVGTKVYMNNSAPLFFPGPPPGFPTDNSPGQRQIMEFRVVAPPPGYHVPKFHVPSILSPAPNKDLHHSTDLERNLTLNVGPANLPFVLLLNNHRFMDPATETPKLGTTEIWSITNLIGTTHPIHIHLVNFLMLDMQTFNQTKLAEGNCSLSAQYPDPLSCFTEPPQPPIDAQAGWKDTIVVFEQKVTRLLLRWKPRYGAFKFDPTLGPGYVWHCHMLDHEDNDMMRPLVMRWT